MISGRLISICFFSMMAFAVFAVNNGRGISLILIIIVVKWKIFHWNFSHRQMDNKWCFFIFIWYTSYYYWSSRPAKLNETILHNTNKSAKDCLLKTFYHMTDRFLAAMNKKNYNLMRTSFRFIEKSLNIGIQFKNTTILRFPRFF